MIKVWTGQVWEFEKGTNNYEIGDRLRILDFDSECEMFDAAPINIVEPSDCYTVTDKFLNKCFKFIPQNDLEWFAVNVDEWTAPSYRKYIVRVDDSDWTYIKSNTYKTHSSTRQEWQNMRYHLGLEKSHGTD